MFKFINCPRCPKISPIKITMFRHIHNPVDHIYSICPSVCLHTRYSVTSELIFMKFGVGEFNTIC
jgi:hypothetical protein